MRLPLFGPLNILECATVSRRGCEGRAGHRQLARVPGPGIGRGHVRGFNLLGQVMCGAAVACEHCPDEALSASGVALRISASFFWSASCSARRWRSGKIVTPCRSSIAV
jgi:hypothetical protein